MSRPARVYPPTPWHLLARPPTSAETVVSRRPPRLPPATTSSPSDGKAAWVRGSRQGMSFAMDDPRSPPSQDTGRGMRITHIPRSHRADVARAKHCGILGLESICELRPDATYI
jgi:hypothetical protein